MAVTPQPPASGATRAQTPPPAPPGASTGELIGRLGDQLTRPVRDEVHRAQAEVTQKAKRLGIGAGVLALVGRKDVDKATPPLPTEAVAGVQADIATVKHGISR